MDAKEILKTLNHLHQEIKAISDKDAEQEVQGAALRILDTVVTEAKKLIPDHPVLKQYEDIISPAAVEQGETIRAVDLRIALVPLIEAIAATIPPVVPRPASVWSPDIKREKF